MISKQGATALLGEAARKELTSNRGFLSIRKVRPDKRNRHDLPAPTEKQRVFRVRRSIDRIREVLS